MKIRSSRIVLQLDCRGCRTPDSVSSVEITRKCTGPKRFQSHFLRKCNTNYKSFSRLVSWWALNCVLLLQHRYLGQTLSAVWFMVMGVFFAACDSFQKHCFILEPAEIKTCHVVLWQIIFCSCFNIQHNLLCFFIDQFTCLPEKAVRKPIYLVMCCICLGVFHISW